MSKPLKSFRVGGLSVALWDNQTGKSVSVEKSKKNGEQFETERIFLRTQEVSCLASLLNRMEREVVEQS